MKKILCGMILIFGLFTTSCFCVQVVTEKQDITSQSKVTNSIGMEFVWIPPTGNKGFLMGSSIDDWFYNREWYCFDGKLFEHCLDLYIESDEWPKHKVIIDIGFWLQTTEVTQKQWEKVMGNNPCRYKGDDVPVYNVSWDDAQEFITKLNLLEKTYTYRLPTEAEWEYACRAGTSTRYYWGDDWRKESYSDYCWSSENSFYTPHPVAEKKPNPWGLYDMSGNLSEWCLDHYDEDFYRTDQSKEINPYNYGRLLTGTKGMKIQRGGSWNVDLYDCRSAKRYSSLCYKKHSSIGFRVLKTQKKENNLDYKIGKPKKIVNNLGMEFVKIPPTSQKGFLMGALKNEKFATSTEMPQHKVIISKAFWLQTTEVTQQQWKLVMGYNPNVKKGSFSYTSLEGDNLPVTMISWNDAQEFIQRLNELDVKYQYRLSTEAEWEYACRAGTKTPYYWGKEINSDYCHTCIDCEEVVLPVGSRKPNKWGLYDMIGNAQEWCEDLFDPEFYDSWESRQPDPCNIGKTSTKILNQRVTRGGSFFDTPGKCRSASRSSYYQNQSMNQIGFRIVMEKK